MRQLFEIDLQDYEKNDRVFRRPSVRGIILKDEDKKEALIRKVKEEVGLIVIPESICEFGSVMRRQKSDVSPNAIFEQENFYYTCNTENQIVEQNLDDYEAEAEFILRFVSLDEAISVNAAYKSEDYFNEIMIKRETKVLQMIKDTQMIMEFI